MLDTISAAVLWSTGSICLAEFQTENATLEVRLSNVGIEKPVTSVIESGREMTTSLPTEGTVAEGAGAEC